MQLRFASFAVINLRRDLHPQECARAGRTTAGRQLIAWRFGNEQTGTRIVSRMLTYGWYVHSTIDDGSDDVFVYRENRDSLGDFKDTQLARLNTRTGALRSLSGGMPAYTDKWLLDAQGEPRVVRAVRDGRRLIYWRDPNDGAWKQVGDFKQFGNEGFEPRHVDADGRWIVSATGQRDTSAYYSYDPASQRMSEEPLVAVQGFDLDALLEFDSRTRKLVGLHFTADRPVSYWFDDRLQALQRGLDAALPGRFNRIYCGRCESTTHFLVRSSSDRQPGEYFVLDSKTGGVQKVGAKRPWIDEASQGRRSFHRVTTRDGIAMPVYVTHPPGAKPGVAAPAGVLVHGGPWMRGADLAWDAEAQFFASRGYRVIEPEFRGSAGYGFRHFELGFKQWGTTMQDDLVDAVRWAGKEGLVDTGRVCVMGSSYGGYAALMAPIRAPGVFRCAIAHAAVTDLDLLQSIHWSDIDEQDKIYGLPTLVGDREKDAALLTAASPLRRAGEIKVPVLLGHGALDRRVPIDHARQFADSARRAGVDIEVVTYGDEGHGWFWDKHHTDFLGRADKLLQRSFAAAP